MHRLGSHCFGYLKQRCRCVDVANAFEYAPLKVRSSTGGNLPSGCCLTDRGEQRPQPPKLVAVLR